MKETNLIFGIVIALMSAAALSLASGSIDGTHRTACVTKEFKTQMYKAACAKGGQNEAKDVAKKFMKDHKIKSCNQCHTKLAPRYELKSDALAQFQKLGGK